MLLVAWIPPLLLAAFQDEGAQEPDATQEPPAVRPEVEEVLNDPVLQIDLDLDPQREPLPMSLEDVIRFVVERAPAIRQSHLAALANAGSVQQAEGAFDPVLFADVTYAYTEQPTSGGLISGGGLANFHSRTWVANQGLRAQLLTGASVEVSLNEQYSEDNLPPGFFGFNPESSSSFNVNIRQPLLRGGWTLTATQQVRAAELAYDRGLADLREATRLQLLAAVDSYWDLAFAREDVKVREFSLRLAAELRAVTLARFRVGTAAEVEVVQTDADIAARTVDLLTARNTARAAEDGLRTLIFTLAEFKEWVFELTPTSPAPPAAVTEVHWEDAFRVANQHRADLEALRVDVASRKLDWEVAQQNILPSLDLVLSGSSSGIARQIPRTFDPTFSFLSAGYSVGLFLEVPLGNNLFRGPERRARVLYELAKRTLRDTENIVANEVRAAVRNLNFQAGRVASTLKSRQVAERQLEAEQRRLREGASTNFQVLQFQEDLAQALSLEKQAAFEYAKALTRLNLVQGLNWEGSPPQRLRRVSDDFIEDFLR